MNIRQYTGSIVLVNIIGNDLQKNTDPSELFKLSGNKIRSGKSFTIPLVDAIYNNWQQS